MNKLIIVLLVIVGLQLTGCKSVNPIIDINIPAQPHVKNFK